jgi:integrase/recombinase XerD
MSLAILEPVKPLTHLEASSLRSQELWEHLSGYTVSNAICEWLGTLSQKTALNYASGMKMLSERGLIDLLQSLQCFSLINHDAAIDRIKLAQGWSECSRQARAACYVSFTGFLARRTQGLIKKATPCREGAAKTFFRVREKVATNAMNQLQWTEFLTALEKINHRDCLIAKLALQGAKRIGEVLSLQREQIDWDAGQIRFVQSKAKGMVKETVITYPRSIMDQLALLVGERDGTVFVTRFGCPVMITQLARSFARAGREAGVPFKVSPHVLRATGVTAYRSAGCSDGDIMKVTGHASCQMVAAYDKSERAHNASRKVSLVS